MTRPMPGPPACDAGAFPHERTAHAACLIHARSYHANSKRLTDAECYDEWGAFEHVESYGLLCIEMGDKRMTPSRFEREANESDTWHRFATRPHALEEA